MEVEDRLYRFADSKTPPDPFLKVPEENSSTSIVIDNGITFLFIVLILGISLKILVAPW